MRWPTTEPATSAFRRGAIINPTSARRSGACCRRSEARVPPEPLVLQEPPVWQERPEPQVPPALREPPERQAWREPTELTGPRERPVRRDHRDSLGKGRGAAALRMR